MHSPRPKQYTFLTTNMFRSKTTGLQFRIILSTSVPQCRPHNVKVDAYWFSKVLWSDPNYFTNLNRLNWNRDVVHRQYTYIFVRFKTLNQRLHTKWCRGQNAVKTPQFYYKFVPPLVDQTATSTLQIRNVHVVYSFNMWSFKGFTPARTNDNKSVYWWMQFYPYKIEVKKTTNQYSMFIDNALNYHRYLISKL